MLKVLLVRPEESRSKYNFKGIIENEPLDLEIIYALLEKEYQIDIFDLQVTETSFKDYIKNNYYDILYIEGRSFQEGYMKEYIHIYKNLYHGLVIVGGQHAQINYELFMIDDVDYILTGYNYYDLNNIIKGNIKDIYNLCYKENNKWIISKKKETDINDLPWPNRKHFYHYQDNYQYLDLKHALWIRSSFSCPYQCEFCLRRYMNNNKYSRRDIYDFINEIEKNDNENIYIVDDDFLFDENYLDTFIKEIKKRNLKKRYICYGRSDFIASHESLMKAFKEIGLYYVLVGLEDIKDLDKYHKLNQIDNNEKSIEICHKYNIRMMAMFILALDFKRKDFNDLYKYIKEKDLKYVALSIYTPEIGLNHHYEYITDDSSHFDYLHLVSKPKYLSIKMYYLYYYILLIKLFLKAQRENIYDFIDYKYYIKTFISNILKGRKSSDA